MARGKYATAAEARQAREDAIARSDRLQREVEKLSRELERRERDSAARESAHAATLAELREHIAQGTSRKVLALEDELATAHREIELRKKGFADMAEAQARLQDLLRRCLLRLGLTPLEAHEQIVRATRYMVDRDRKGYVDMGEHGDVIATENAESDRLTGVRDAVIRKGDRDAERLIRFQELTGKRHKDLDLP